MLTYSAGAAANVSVNATAFPLAHRQAWLKYHNWFTVWFAVMVTICIIGASANLLLLLVIRLTKRVFSGSEILIFCLILFELLSCAVTTPLYTMSVYFAESAPLSQTFCNYATLINNGSLRIRYVLEAFLAFNRFSALLFPLHYPKIAKLSVIYGMIVVASSVIVFDFLLFYPVLGRIVVALPFASCGFSVYSHFGPLYIITSYIALAFTGVCYLAALLSILVKKMMTQKQIVPQVQGRSVVNTQKRVKITAILLSAFLWRTTCYLPAWLLVSAFPMLLYKDPTLVFVLRILYLIASATSPVRKNADLV